MTSPLDQAFDTSPRQSDALTALKDIAAKRILVLDGAMGTQIQGLGLDESHFRGERFIACDCQLQGNNDLLTLTQPDAIEFDSLRLRDGRRRHSGDQYLLLDLHRAGRLRDGGTGL